MTCYDAGYAQAIKDAAKAAEEFQKHTGGELLNATRKGIIARIMALSAKESERGTR